MGEPWSTGQESVDVAAHKTRHQNGGADEVSVTGLSGLLADDQHVLDAEVVAVAIALTQKAAASGVASLDASSKVVQDPANATATPTADKIPIADGSGLLDGWVTPGGVGGLYGINVATLSGNITLTSGTDKIYQYLDEGGANRIITLDTDSATAGDRWVIRHNGVYTEAYYLDVKQAATSLHRIFAGSITEFIFDGTNWVSRGIGTGENDNKKLNVNIGYGSQAYDIGTSIGGNSQGHTKGMAVGYSCQGYNYGAAIGMNSSGYTYGTAIGYGANGADYGVSIGGNSQGYTNGVGIGYRALGANYAIAIGYYAGANSKKYSIALGYYSETERTGETSININGDDTDQENNVVQGRWERTTANATPVEIFCAGQANQRFLIRASSVLAFTMLIVARDNVAGHVARYSVADGLIKRNAANNTTMVACTVSTDYEDDAGWAVAVTADDTNEALIITVTGDATNPTQWAAVMDGVETHF